MKKGFFSPAKHSDAIGNSFAMSHKLPPLVFRIDIGELPQKLHAQTGGLRPRQSFLKDSRRAPGYVLEERRLRFAQSDQPIAAVRSRAEHAVIRFQCRP